MLRYTLLLAALLVGLYAGFCGRVATAFESADGKRMLLIGRVVASDGTAGNSAYDLSDPTGELWMTSRRGAPAEKSLCLVLIVKKTTRTGRPYGQEILRLGTF